MAVSEDERQFNIEMENHSERDSVPKRARFYQGLIDISPSRIAMYIRDIAKMLTDMNQELVMQQNVKKWHFITLAWKMWNLPTVQNFLT